MKLFWLKLQREFLRVLNIWTNKEKAEKRMKSLQDGIARVQARNTLEQDIPSLFTVPANTPKPQPIDILIPVYNGFEFLNPCLESIFRNTDLPFHLYLADDASPDEKVLPLLQKWAAKKAGQITLLQNEHNGGFAKTVNKLIQASAHDFALLNTDTEVPPGWASRLFYPIFTNENIASSGPWSNAGGAYQSLFFDNEETALQLPLEETDDLLRIFSPESYVLLPNLMGFCMAVSRTAVKQGGLFDEAYGRGYFEETDWCFRLNRLGKKHALVSNLFVYHKGFSSFGNTARFEILHQNRTLFKKRYPGALAAMRRARFTPKLQLIHFILLARYLRTQYNGFSSENAESTAPALCTQQKGEIFYYELRLGEKRQYACSRTDLRPYISMPPSFTRPV